MNASAINCVDIGSTEYAFSYKAAYPLVIYIGLKHKNLFDTLSTSEKEIQERVSYLKSSGQKGCQNL
jgi:hypothetical protein